MNFIYEISPEGLPLMLYFTPFFNRNTKIVFIEAPETPENQYEHFPNLQNFKTGEFGISEALT